MYPEYGCICILPVTPSPSRVYPATGWSNLSRGLYPCPHIKPKELQIAQPIGHLCDGRHMQEVQGCCPLSWQNSAMSYSFVVSYLRLYFWYRGPHSMAPSSLGVNIEDLIIQSPVEDWSLHPLFQFDSWGDGNMPLALSWTLNYGFLFNLNPK